MAVDALVDAGAPYTVLPRRMVANLSMEPEEQMHLVLAGGPQVIRDLALVVVRLEGRVRATPCVLDDEAPEALLGAVPLEEFGVRANPVARRLVPTAGYLLCRVARAIRAAVCDRPTAPWRSPPTAHSTALQSAAPGRRPGDRRARRPGGREVRPDAGRAAAQRLSCLLVRTASTPERK